MQLVLPSHRRGIGAWENGSLTGLTAGYIVQQVLTQGPTYALTRCPAGGNRLRGPNVGMVQIGRCGEPELKLPSDVEVDKVISFLEKVWRRLIEMGRAVQKEVEKNN